MKKRSWVKKAGICLSSLVLIMALGVGCATNQQIKEDRAATEAAMKKAQDAATKAEASADRTDAAADRIDAAADRIEASADRAEKAAAKCERTFEKGLRK